MKKCVSALVYWCAAAAMAAGVADAKPRAGRLVPVAPLLSAVTAADARITFHYTGDLEDAPEKYEVGVSVANAAWRFVPMTPQCRAEVNLGALAEGRHALCVGIRKSGAAAFVRTNSYAITAVKKTEGPRGRKLNNFVTELVWEKTATGTIRFFNPHEGWVWIGSARNAAGRMRYCAAGWQDVTAAAAEGLSIRAVPRLVAIEPWLFGESDLDKWRWGRAFTERYILPNYNTAAFYNVTRKNGGPYGQSHAELRRHGFRIEGIVGMAHNDPDRADVARIRARLAGSVTAQEGFDLIVDENGIACGDRIGKVNFAEALWPDCAAGAPAESVAANTFFCDARESLFEDAPAEISGIAAIVNSGNGRGMLYPEVYSAALADARAAHRWEDHFVRFRARTLELVPAAAHRFLYFFGTFLEFGDWCDWAQPEGDIRVLYDDFFRRIATDPAYGAPGGLAAGYFNHTDDDVARWCVKAIRHYAIEGHTNGLAAACGLRYLPGHVRNPDFTQGFADWSPHAAAEGSLVPARVAGYGTKVQGRKEVPAGTGDTVARFVRQPTGANTLAQKLTGLETGACYAVMFAVADEDEVAAPLSISEPKPLVATIGSGGEVIPELGYVHKTPRDRDWEVRAKGRKNPLKLTQRIVFRATAPEALLAFSDAAAAPGRRTILNFVNVRRYWVEDEAELAFLKTLKRKTTKGIP